MTKREAVHAAVGNVLVNAFNYPEKVQTRILGQDLFPLIEKVVDSLVAAGVVATEHQTSSVTALDLDAIQRHLERMDAWELRPAHHRRHRITTEEGGSIVHGYHPDYIASLIAVTEDVPALVAEVERQADAAARLLAVVEPIIERNKDRVGTHTLDGSCAQYHVECLAVMVRAAIGPAVERTSDSSSTGSQL